MNGHCTREPAEARYVMLLLTNVLASLHCLSSYLFMHPQVMQSDAVHNQEIRTRIKKLNTVPQNPIYPFYLIYRPLFLNLFGTFQIYLHRTTNRNNAER